MATDVPTFVKTTWVPDAAPGISAAELQRLDDQADHLSIEFNLHNGGVQTSDHPIVTVSDHGFMGKNDLIKLNTIETNAKDDQSLGELGGMPLSGAEFTGLVTFAPGIDMLPGGAGSFLGNGVQRWGGVSADDFLVNIGGQTVHSFLGCGVPREKKDFNRMWTESTKFFYLELF